LAGELVKNFLVGNRVVLFFKNVQVLRLSTGFLPGPAPRAYQYMSLRVWEYPHPGAGITVSYGIKKEFFFGIIPFPGAPES
jgi:hypothetical protein